MNTFPNPLTSREERECLERLKEGDQEARMTLIEHNMRLVAHVVKKYQYTDYEIEDLLSVGTIGLIKAVNTFNMNRGPKLATYAAKCVENAILSQMRKLYLSLFPCFRYGCGFDNRIQELYFLRRRTIQFFNILIDHICVYTGNTLGQFTLSFFRFRVIDNHIDWSTLSCDTTHLPRYFSL